MLPRTRQEAERALEQLLPREFFPVVGASYMINGAAGPELCIPCHFSINGPEAMHRSVSIPWDKAGQLRMHLNLILRVNRIVATLVRARARPRL